MTVSKRGSTVHQEINGSGRPLKAEDLWTIPRVGAPAPFPDGSKAVVPVTSYDIEANEGRTRLWLVPADGGDPRPLTSPDVSSSAPAVSPDATRVAFVRKAPKDAGGGGAGGNGAPAPGADRPQLWIMPLDGGEAEKVTDMPLGVSDPRWFPDGKKIAFVSAVIAGHTTPEATAARIREREKDPVKAHVTEDRIYRYWDHWLTGGEVPHVFLLDLSTRAMRDLTPDSTGWFDLMEPEGSYDISPDGKEIVFSANSSEPPHHLVRWAIYTVPVAGGALDCLTPDHKGDDIRPRYSPDGRRIVYGMQTDPFFYADRVRLVSYDRTERKHTVLTEDWDRSAGAWEFTDDGALILLAEDRARVCAFALAASRVESGGGTPASIARGGTLSGLRPAGGRLFYTRQSLSEPAEIYSCEPDGSGEKRLTRFTDAALEGVARGEVLEVEFEGAREARIQMYVVLPPGYTSSRKYPLVHVIHGGPHGISGDQFHPRWNAQLFAAPGYVVAMVNFHGSTSWGQDFAKCIQGAWGDRPGTDIDRATDWLIGQGLVDERRMAITGGSYGGYLVSWIGSQTSRYACIVNHAGVYDTLSQYASDVTQGRHASFGGEPWSGLEKIDRWNPARFAEGYSTPMLVIHGERDYRVPLTQGIEIYNVLKAKGVPSRLVYFPDENHWVLKPRNSIFWYGEVHGWLERWLSGDGTGHRTSAGSTARTGGAGGRGAGNG